MIQTRKSSLNKSTNVRLYSWRNADAVTRGGRTGRMVRHHGRRFAAHLARKPDMLEGRMESGRDRLVVGALSLIVAGYAVAVLARIAVQYGL